MSNLVHFSGSLDTLKTLVHKSASLVVVDFYANWCGPCRHLAPHFEQMSKEFPKIPFLKVNVDESPEISDHFGITSIPTVKGLKYAEEGIKEVGSVVGFNPSGIKSMIESNV